jgi:hypothetical protein
MPPELNKLLIDIQVALLEIQEFTAGMNLNSYRADSTSAKQPWRGSLKLLVKHAHG